MRPITSFTVQSLVVQECSKGQISLIVMPYTFINTDGSSHTTLRLPAETGKIGESVADTVMRGLREEIAEDENDPDFRIEIIGFNTAELVDDSKNPTGCHAKISVLVRHISGALRKVVKADSENSNEIHGVPYLSDPRDVFKNTHGKPRLLKAHGVSIARYIMCRTNSDMNFAWNYSSLPLDFYLAVKDPTPDELSEVLDFAGDLQGMSSP